MDYYSQYANLPAATTPPGVVSNLDNPPTRALELYIGMGICIAVTAISLALRMYAKFIVTHKPGWDDLACSIGFALFVAQIAVTFTITGSHGALGKHMWDSRIGQFTKAYEQKSLTTLDLYSAAAFFIKLSLFLLYLRLFKPNKFTRWLIYGGIITCGLFYSASIIANCVMFMPTPGQPNNNSAWLLRASKSIHGLLVLGVVQSVFGTLSDIYLLVIPIQIIFQLHFPTERKIGVSAVFMIGILAIACSLALLVYRVKELGTTDQTWSGVSPYLFGQVHLRLRKISISNGLSSVELSAGIVGSCMPICACLVHGHTPKKLHYPSLRHIYFTLRSRSFRRPLVSDQTHSLDKMQLNKRDSYLEIRSKSYTQLENGSGGESVKNSVLTPRERLEY